MRLLERLKICGAVSILTLGLLMPFAQGAGETAALRTHPAPLNPKDADMTWVGSLRCCGSLKIEFDNPDYGEWSGLATDQDGTRLLIVADDGHWYSATLRFDNKGWLTDLADLEVALLKNPEGRTIQTKYASDAESVVRLADGSMAISFERAHRIWRYPSGERPLSGVPQVFPKPPEMKTMPANEGIEALVELADGRLLALVEHEERGDFQGFIKEGADWNQVALKGHEGHHPSSATVLPNGDVLVVERRYREEDGVSVRLRRIPANDIEAGAVLEGYEVALFEPPLLFDNLEGIAAHAMADGWTRIFLVSDNNLNPEQQTLLLCFLLHG
jgi:hypothetical protein